jgi:glycosyltransferase involved in cell wall biosynthesis
VTAAFSIIIPVHNEAALLPVTIPVILNRFNPHAKLIYVCNGCTDDSAHIIRTLAGSQATLIETHITGKPNAIRMGEATAGEVFPRFFVDADISMKGEDFDKLAGELAETGTELVSPLAELDTTGCTYAARKIVEVWSNLPFMKQSAFRTVIGVSREGRSRWKELPNVIADDTFMAMQIAPQSRKIVSHVRTVERVPRTFWACVGVRARWLMGDWELRKLGFQLYSDSQKKALLDMLRNSRTILPASIYLSHRLCATLLAKWWILQKNTNWYRDETSRQF